MVGKGNPDDAAAELGRALYAAIRAAVRDELRAAGTGSGGAAPGGPLAIKPAQAAKMLNLSDKRTYELLSQGKLPGFKVDGRWLVNVRRLQAWMDEQTDGAGTT